MRVNKVIVKPIVTEKSMAAGDSNKYHFKVGIKASKDAIAENVEDLFDVDVVSVRTMIMPGKKKRIGKTWRFTKTKKWKKAVVEVMPGQKIKLVEEAK